MTIVESRMVSPELGMYKYLRDACYRKIWGSPGVTTGSTSKGKVQINIKDVGFLQRTELCQPVVHEYTHLAFGGCGNLNRPGFWACYCNSERFANAAADTFDLVLIGAAVKCVQQNSLGSF